MQTDPASIERIFHALGDSTRRTILEKLSEGPISVSRLTEPLGVSLAAVLQHVQILEESGLVRTQKSGRVRTCHVERAGLSIAIRWLNDRRSLWDHRIDRLGELLAETEKD